MSLPWEARVFVLYYRKDLLEEKGLSASKTLAEWQEVAKQTAGSNRLGFAVGLSEGGNAASFVETFIPLLRAYGGELFDAGGKAAFNSEAGVKAIQYIKDMVASGAMNEQAISMTADDVTNGLKAGNISTAISGSMRASAIRGSDIGQHIATMPVPPAEEGQLSPTMVAGQTLSIGVNTKYPDEAFEFIKYFLTKESQIKWAGAGVMPVLSSAYDDPAVKELATYDEMISWKEEASKSGQIVFYPEDYAKLSVELAKAGQQMIFQNAPIKETLDNVAAQYNQGK
jgi:ABC-type glycerol-3-phosphate transport system substrate-binding protein